MRVYDSNSQRLKQWHYLCICTASKRTGSEMDFMQITEQVVSVNKDSSDRWCSLIHNNIEQIIPLSVTAVLD